MGNTVADRNVEQQKSNAKSHKGPRTNNIYLLPQAKKNLMQIRNEKLSPS
jgi:hypothetical protein